MGTPPAGEVPGRTGLPASEIKRPVRLSVIQSNSTFPPIDGSESPSKRGDHQTTSASACPGRKLQPPCSRPTRTDTSRPALGWHLGADRAHRCVGGAGGWGWATLLTFTGWSAWPAWGCRSPPTRPHEEVSTVRSPCLRHGTFMHGSFGPLAAGLMCHLKIRLEGEPNRSSVGCNALHTIDNVHR